MTSNSVPFPAPGSTTVDFALWYADQGWPVVQLHGLVEWIDELPCRCPKKVDCGSAGKHPKSRDWPNLASVDPEIILRWWNIDPLAGVGIVTGRRSGLVVIDIDPRNGGDETIRDLEAEHGPFPSTIEALSGGGGRHLYFDTEDQPYMSASGALGDGVDVKADGGMIVAAPTLHQSGSRYEWEVEHHPEDTKLVILPEWTKVTLRDHSNRQSDVLKRARMDPALVLAGVPEGERNETLFRYACSLRAQGVDILVAFAKLSTAAANCTPPLSLHEVDELLGSAYTYPVGTHGSTNTPPMFRVEPYSTWATEVDAAPNPGWIAEPVWPGDAYGVLAAESKTGKTWFQLDLAVSVATGTKWMNAYSTEQGTVAVFLGEGGDRNTVRRIRGILAGGGLTDESLGDRLHLCFRVPHLTDEEHIKEMHRALSKIGAVRLVILDPLYLAAGGANGASLYDMAVPLEAAQHAAQRAGAALVVIHHFNQTGRGTGASRMSGAGPEEWGRVLATVTVAHRSVTDDSRTETAHLVWEFTGSEIVPTTLAVKRTISVANLTDLTSAMRYEIEPTTIPKKQKGSTEAVLDVLHGAEDWYTTTEIHARVSSSSNVSKRTVEVVLKELHDEGQVKRQGAQSTGYAYREVEPPAVGGAQ